MPDDPVFHLALPVDWIAAFDSGAYKMSTRGLTLDEVGFIHCSTHAQIEATANRFYGDLDQLVLLTIDPMLVDSAVVWEAPAQDVEELFPHIYGPLPISAINNTRYWMRGPAGWRLDS